MPEGKHLLYEFGDFQLDPARHILLRQGEPVALAPRLFDTLVLLVKNRGRVLEKEELLQTLWPETFVEDGNLSQNIFLLRKLLGDDRNGHSFIHTVPRRGYEFIATVTESEAPAPLADPSVAEYWSRHSPFRSLQAFEPEDAWLFFGRDAEVQDLLRRLGRSPVLAMVGNSGSGKSSLLRAGLIPALRAGRFCNKAFAVGGNGSMEASSAVSWRIAVLRPSAAPFDYLAEVLPSQLAPELSIRQQAEFIAGSRIKLRAGGDALRDAISALVLAATEGEKAGHTRVLLVVDQFEELFTLTSKPEIRNRYVDGLLAAARWDSAVPVHLVLALRADFYGYVLEHTRLSRCLETNLYNVPRMTPEQMRETIEKRLQLTEGRAEPGLIDSLLEDVGAEPGNLALLEHALGQLWERCGGPGCTFTSHAYTEIGRLRGALGRHADEVYQSLGSVAQQRLAQRVFLELVHLGEGAQDTRRRVNKAELLGLGAPEEVETLLSRLATSRLIATGRDGEDTFVEVSHEALIREWPALREWIRQNREELGLERRLSQAAEEWSDLSRDPGALLLGTRLALAEDWLGRHGDAPEVVREYVQASVESRAEAAREEREAQERELSQQKATARRFRWFSYALAFLLLVAAGSAWLAYHQRVLEKSRAMAAQAEALASKDRGRALDLAIRSWDTAKTKEARLAVAKIFPEPLLTLNHEDAVTITVFSPDGQRILSAADDHTARLWSANDGRLLATLRHEDLLEYAAFSPDGQRIVTASNDHTARIWDATDGRLLAVLKGHTGEVWRAQFAPDSERVITASADDSARVWEVSTGRQLMMLKGHSGWLSDVTFSPNGQLVLTASMDKTARLWNATNGQLVAILQGHTGSVRSARFSPDGRRIVTAGFDGTGRVWDASDGRLLNVLRNEGAVDLAVFSPDGQRIATASFDNAARLWNSSDGRLLATLPHDGPVVHVEFSSDGRRIATASFDHTARVWSVNDGRLLAILQGHSREVFHVAFAPSGEQIVTGSADHTARVWRLRSARVPAVLSDKAPLRTALFSPDGKLIATAGENPAPRVWSAADGRLRFELKGHSDKIGKIEFSSNGQQMVTASVDGTARVWSTHAGSLLHTLAGHGAQVNTAVFSPDDKSIVTASNDHTARVWSAADGRLLTTLQGHTAEVNSAMFSPDGQRIVTAANDDAVRVWNAADGRLLANLEGHTAKIYVAVFSPDGKYIVSASKDHTARLWDTGGHTVAILQGHSAEVFAACFSPDGKLVLTTGKDHTARLWNTNGHLLATLNHAEEVWVARFSPDGRSIVTGSSDGAARVWSVPDGRLLTTLPGHSFLVVSAAFSPEGGRILTGSYDQTARLWEFLSLDDIEQILAK